MKWDKLIPVEVEFCIDNAIDLYKAGATGCSYHFILLSTFGAVSDSMLAKRIIESLTEYCAARSIDCRYVPETERFNLAIDVTTVAVNNLKKKLIDNLISKRKA